MRRKRRNLKKSKFAGWIECTEVHGTMLYVHRSGDEGNFKYGVTMEGYPPADSILKLIEFWCESLAGHVTLSEYTDWILARDLNPRARATDPVAAVTTEIKTIE